MKKCADHELHAAMLGHVADYCPECERAFDPKDDVESDEDEDLNATVLPG